MVNQHENPFYEKHVMAMQRVHKNIYKTFDICKVFQSHIPTYPSGQQLFGFASKKYHPYKDIREGAWKALKIETKYYNTLLHKGAFMLPNFVTELLTDVE
jgi:spermidine synthase